MIAAPERLDEAAAFDSHVAEKARREFLTFRLGEETYGIDILQVQEIREIEAVTRVPHVAAYTRGVINLRGAIVPVVDLGLMLGFAEPLPLENASAIVLHAEGRLVGLVVGSVSDVIALAEDEIRPPPMLDNHVVGRAISGIGMRAEDGGASVLLLDAEHVLHRIREERA